MNSTYRSNLSPRNPTAGPARVILAVLLLAPLVHASDVAGISRPIESRLGSCVVPVPAARPRALQTPTAPAAAWSAVIGVAHTDPQNGANVLTTPFELSVEQGTVTYTLSGDGYTRPSGSATGLADPTLLVRNVFW